jgi:hypothetical protein
LVENLLDFIFTSKASLFVVYNNFVLLPILVLELSLKNLLVKLDLAIDTGLASAVVGALGACLLAPTILLVTLPFAVASFSDECAFWQGDHFLLKRIFVNLHGLLNHELPDLIVLLCIETV